MKCPRCIGKLEEKTYNIRGSHSVSVDICWTCSGIWFDEGEMRKVQDLGIEKTAPSWADPWDMNVIKKDAKCPKCVVPLKAVRNMRDLRIVQDMCPKCFGVWLDGGELGLLQRGNLFEQLIDALFRSNSDHDGNAQHK